jgi:hypothetical protein
MRGPLLYVSTTRQGIKPMLVTVKSPINANIKRSNRNPKFNTPVSTCEDTSTQNPCVLALCKLMILAKNMTIAAPQNTINFNLITTIRISKVDGTHRPKIHRSLPVSEGSIKLNAF